ncbi:MAG: domain protein DegV family [Peptococcaceae bacterium]|nr:domain protein DegV family [Peptococcaceae bacterium]
MSQVKIVTDSTADLPLALIKELGITVVPLKVLFGEKVYREGVDISAREFYEKLKESDKLPTTSQPSPGEFQEVFNSLSADGSSVISIHISANMSGTYQAALIAKNALPGRDVTVIDSKLVSMALGLVVIEAARAAKAGKDKSEIINIAHDVMNKVHTYFVVDTLEYLQKGGRIGKASALLGTMLNIKPILTLHDGYVASFEKIRGKGKALERILELARNFSDAHEDHEIRCALTHSNVLDEAVTFHKRLISELKYSEHIISDIGAVVGTHTGPGTIALFFYAD